MGHLLANPDLAYQRLQQRLDRMPTGAPDSAVFQQILRLLFTEEEAQIAAAMPTVCSMAVLAKRTGSTVEELDPKVDAMAAKGLVLDLENKGERYVALAPVVIGFFEFTFMRVREDARWSSWPSCSTSTCSVTTRSPTRSSREAPRSAARWCARNHCPRTRRWRCSTGSWPRTSSPRPTAWRYPSARAGRT